MYKCMTIAAFVAIAAVYFSGVVGETGQLGHGQAGISTRCLGCLCEAVSGCNRTIGCQGDICGLFHITWSYWSDAGKPTLGGEAPDTASAFTNCVNDAFCAARAVQGYMAKFQHDCNLDGKIDCLDYALIHKLGGYGCQGTLPVTFEHKLDSCLQQVGRDPNGPN